MPKTETGQQYHRILDRYVHRYFGSADSVPPAVLEFLAAVNQSFLQIEENRAVYERAMELSSRELAEKNKELEAQSIRQRIILANIENSLKDLGAELHGEQDLIKIADILAREIKRRKQAEELTRISEDKFRNIIEHMQLGLVEVDLEGRITHVYDWFLKMSGYKADEIIGKPARETLLDPVSWPELDKQLESRKRGEFGVYEALLRRRHGDNMWVIISGAPLFDVDKKVIGSVGIFFDITHQKLTEEALDRALKESEKAMNAREMFFASVSHEIRTPMNAILGMSRLLRETELDSEQQEYLNAIRSSADGLMGIINDVLDLSKMKSGKFSIDRVEFNPSKLLKELHPTVNMKALEKDIEFRLDMDESLDAAYFGDPVRLRQILINLTGNAVKFTQQGHVRLGMKLADKGNNFDVIRFEVEDTGIGIPEDKFSELFETFSQVHSPESGRFEGTGLGLSISRQLVELMDGELKVVSEVGKGSCFSFELALKPCKSEAPQKPERIDFSGLEEKRILLVEDNALNRFLATTILKQWRIKVSEAESGEQALMLAGEHHFDAIIMDMQMPGMDGIETTRRMRDSGNPAPIVALTANALKGEQEKCFQAGMDAFISKPFNPEELFEVLSSLILHRGAGNRISPGALNAFTTSSAESLSFTLDVLRRSLPSLNTQMETLIEEGELEKARHLAMRWRTRVELLKGWEIGQTLKYLAEACGKQHSEHALLWSTRLKQEIEYFLEKISNEAK